MMDGKTLGKLGAIGFVASLSLSVFSKWLSSEGEKYKEQELKNYVDSRVNEELDKRMTCISFLNRE